MECQTQAKQQESSGQLSQNERQNQAGKMVGKAGVLKGKDHPHWKGNNVGYHALHAWVERELGMPNKCSECGTEKAKRFHWANVSGKYKRDLSDWKRMCCKCHMKFDTNLLARGEKNGFSKLTDASVLKIRELYSSKKSTLLKLSIEHGVSKSCIWWIVKGITWKHLINKEVV